MVDANTRALIFDLFGTLVGTFSFQAHEQVVAEMAALLGVPRADFAVWYVERTGWGRILGEFASVEANLKHICAQLGVEPDPTRIAAAAGAMLDFNRDALTPREGAMEALAEAKSMGYKLGLISDCSPAVPHLWPDTPFAALIDAPVFSCAVGLRKPDPRIYELACERLGASVE